MISKFTQQNTTSIFNIPCKFLLILLGVFLMTNLNAQTVLNGNFTNSIANWGCSPEANHPETVYGGTNGANLVAEIDAIAGLCQTISGFTIGKSYTLLFKCSRRATTPVLQSMTVAIDGGALTANVSRNGTPFSFVLEHFTFLATSTIHTLSFVATSPVVIGRGLILDDITIIPTQLPGGIGANLQLWLKANEGPNTTSNGANVSTWADQSIQGNDALGVGFDPTYSITTAELINYNPVVNFTSVNTDHLNLNNTLNISNNSLNDFTLFGLSRGSAPLFLGGQRSPTVPPHGAFEFAVGGGGNVRILRYNAGGCHTLQGVAGLFPSTDFAIVKARRFSNSTNDFVNDRIGNTIVCNNAHPTVNLRLGGGGAGTFGNRYSDQNMGELIVYDRALSDAEQRKVDTYLAIKYAQTLSHVDAGIHGDYEATDGTLIWDASLAPAYQNDIIGLGRDDIEALNHQQSHTLDDTVRIYLNTLTQRNDLNAGSFSNDISYIVIGSNDGAMCDNLVTNTEVPATCNLDSRLEREWKVTKTNMIENVNLDLKLGPCQTTNSITAANLRLLVDDDGDFSNGGTSCYFNGDGTGLVITYLAGNVTLANIANIHLPNNSTRFITLASTDAFLPVDLLAFGAACVERNIVLNWTTTAEVNNDHFMVERSADAINFEPLAVVNAQLGQMNHFYEYTDEQPLEGVNYYRLQQVDLDGTKTPSNIISATCTTSETNAIRIFPNPFNHQLTISNLSKLSFPIQIEVYNNVGQAVYKKRLEKECPNTTLDLGNRLVAGVYVLKITNSEMGLSKKVIKQ